MSPSEQRTTWSCLCADGGHGGCAVGGQGCEGDHLPRL